MTRYIHTLPYMAAQALACSAICLLMAACGAKVPSQASASPGQPRIEPDYGGLVIPVNIAPLNFSIGEPGEKFVTNFRTRDGKSSLAVAGRTLDISVDRWHQLLRQAQGDTLYADVYVRQGGAWRRHAPLRYFVAEEIDPYISYRHIEPLYVCYEKLRIQQRCLENFHCKDIYNNTPYLNPEGDRQCINCHSYQDYNRGGNMQMHVRVVKPGTVIVKDGKLRKVNFKVDGLWSVGQYLSWHPSQPVIAYSINDTWQHFHAVDGNKVEVQDGASGLILYNVDTNEARIIADSPAELETFPYWSPDGKWLYYVSASVPELSKEQMANYRMDHYKDIKYNIYRLPYDAQSMAFGPVDTVFMASDYGMSATFPRESPDGRFLMFTMGEYGTFHNFHHDADLYMIDLRNGAIRPVDELNSDDTESYHSFSSNGRWLVFSSRRDNGSYTRLYLAHFDENGRASKPFILPQKSPFANDLLFKSYNVPEFMAEPVRVKHRQWIQAIDADPVDVKLVEANGGPAA